MYIVHALNSLFIKRANMTKFNSCISGEIVDEICGHLLMLLC